MFFAKSKCSICLGATMRDAEIFGVNPDEYDPSRWMTSHGRGGTQQGCLEDMLKALELNFGSGTSKCLGQKVALLELAIFLSKVSLKQVLISLRCFNLPQLFFPCLTFSIDDRVRVGTDGILS
jgi:hypothetical protein